MPEAKARELADASDLIVNDYAFVRGEAGVRALNLRTGKATIFSESGEVCETNMDDIDIAVARRYFHENKKFMG